MKNQALPRIKYVVLKRNIILSGAVALNFEQRIFQNLRKSDNFEERIATIN